MSNEDERLLTRTEASNYLRARGYHVAISTLAKFACIGGGPQFIRFGRKPMYRPSDLMTWVGQRCTPHMSEPRPRQLTQAD